jgi:hypothetical protein
MLKSSFFISYDGVYVFVLLFCVTVMFICTVTFSVITSISSNFSSELLGTLRSSFDFHAGISVCFHQCIP